MLHRSWFPDRWSGDRVVLKRHVPGNLAAFMRWYADPEVVPADPLPGRPDAPGRRSSASSRPASSGPIRWRWRSTSGRSDRLLGTCAFSQLDGENGSALFHITIGEKDAWGQGFGTEATRLMLEHAFERLRLHRIGLSVFAFNERAIRSYRRAGFVIEGRAREAIRRDGRWWDEVEMSILDSDWRAIASAAAAAAGSARAAGGRPTGPARSRR